jgi:hypothetical protein
MQTCPSTLIFLRILYPFHLQIRFRPSPLRGNISTKNQILGVFSLIWIYSWKTIQLSGYLIIFLTLLYYNVAAPSILSAPKVAYACKYSTVPHYKNIYLLPLKLKVLDLLEEKFQDHYKLTQRA